MTRLLPRLASQLEKSGMKGDTKAAAAAILTRRGQMKGGELTAEGRKREALGAAGRAKDRAAKAHGGKPDDYSYNPRSNYAKRKQ